jgi:O-antigen/teichoic acid export membrane protein
LKTIIDEMNDDSRVNLAVLAKKIFAGAGLRGTSFLAVRIIQFARLFIFARLFTPSDLGLVSLAVGCISIMTILANLGFSQSIIRKQNSSPRFTNTVFTLSLIFGFLVFLVALIIAPLFSRIFSAELDPYIRFLAILTLSIPIRFPSFVWEKDLKYGHSSAALVIGEGSSFLVAVGLQFFYYLGVWSVLIGTVTGFLLSGLYIWIFTVFRPKLELDNEYIRPLLSFGAPLMVYGLNGEAMSRGDNLMVGAYSGPTELSYYNFAWQLPTLISSLTQTVDATLLPVYSKLSHDLQGTRRLFNLTNKMWAITGSFLGFAILIFAEDIVNILYGQQWMPVVPILRIMSISFLIRYCSGYSYDNLVLVRGRTKYVMKWGLVNVVLIFTFGQLMIFRMGPIGGAWFWVIQAVVLIPLVRLPLIYQELGTFEFAKHIWQPPLAGVLASVLCVTAGIFLHQHNISKTLIMALIYVVLYGAFLIMMDVRLRLDLVKLSVLISKQD